MWEKILKSRNVNGMRTDVVEALKQIRIPVLRWPGGCFADEYHWKDGIGPKESRKKMINTNWGGVVEDNSLRNARILRAVAVSWAVRLISTATWEAEPYRKCLSG